jgi:hypothetical protein
MSEAVHGSDMSVPFCQILSRWSGFHWQMRPVGGCTAVGVENSQRPVAGPCHQLRLTVTAHWQVAVLKEKSAPVDGVGALWSYYSSRHSLS